MDLRQIVDVILFSWSQGINNVYIL